MDFLLLLVISLVSILAVFSCKKLYNRRKKMKLHGELLVSSTDKVDIHLESTPKHVNVFFKEDCHSVPCNPRHYDKLEWEIIKHHHHPHKLILRISWDVFNTSVIMYEVKF